MATGYTHPSCVHGNMENHKNYVGLLYNIHTCIAYVCVEHDCVYGERASVAREYKNQEVQIRFMNL